MHLWCICVFTESISVDILETHINLSKTAEVHRSTEVLLAFLRGGSGGDNKLAACNMFLCIYENDNTIARAIELLHNCQSSCWLKFVLFSRCLVTHHGTQVSCMANCVCTSVDGNSGAQAPLWDWKCVPLQSFSSDAHCRISDGSIVSPILLNFTLFLNLA
jgi:hypothetical protein